MGVCYKKTVEDDDPLIISSHSPHYTAYFPGQEHLRGTLNLINCIHHQFFQVHLHLSVVYTLLSLISAITASRCPYT